MLGRSTATPGRIFLATLGLMGLLFPFTQHLFLPVTPSIKAEFGTSDVITQLTVSVPSFIMAFMTLAYGSLSDRLGRQPVLIVGILLFTAGGFMTAFATSIWQLILGRLIQGAGGACGMVLARAIARDIFGMDGLVKIIAILTMTISIGSMIAPPLGGFLVDYAGWRSVMFCATGIGAVAVLLAAAVLYETHHDRQAARAGGSLFRDYLSLFSNLRFTAFVLQSGFISASFFSLAAANSLLMSEYLSLPASDFGLYFFFFPIGYLLGNFTSSRLAGKIGIETMVLSGALLLMATATTFALWVLFLPVTPWVLFIPGFFITFSQGIALPSAQTGAIGTTRTLAGTAAGIGVFMQMFWPGVFIQLYGAISDGTPMPIALTVYLAALLSLIFAVVAWRGRE